MRKSIRGSGIGFDRQGSEPSPGSIDRRMDPRSHRLGREVGARNAPRSRSPLWGNRAYRRRSSHPAIDRPGADLVPVEPGQARAGENHRRQEPPKSLTGMRRRPSPRAGPRSAAMRREGILLNRPFGANRPDNGEHATNAATPNRVEIIVRIDQRCQRSANRVATLTTAGSIGKRSSLINGEPTGPKRRRPGPVGQCSVAVFSINCRD